MSILLECMCGCHLHVWCLWNSEEKVKSPGTGAVDGCELPCGCWELNLEQEQQVLPITDLPLQLHRRLKKMCVCLCECSCEWRPDNTLGVIVRNTVHLLLDRVSF
jgi:hypothetical protein